MDLRPVTTRDLAKPGDPGHDFRVQMLLTLGWLTVGSAVLAAVVAVVRDRPLERPQVFAASVVVLVVVSAALTTRRSVTLLLGLPVVLPVLIAVVTGAALTMSSSAVAGSRGGYTLLVFIVAFACATMTTRDTVGLILTVLGTAWLIERVIPGSLKIESEVAWWPVAIIVIGGLAHVLVGDLLRRVSSAWRMEQAAADRANTLALVAGAAREVSSLDAEETLRRVVATALRLGFDSGNVSLFDDDLTTYNVMHPLGFGPDYGSDPLPTDIGMNSMVVDTKATVVVDDYAVHPRAIPALRDAGYHATIAVPIFGHGSKLVGSLIAGSMTDYAVAPHTVEAFELLASLAGRALENAQRFEAEQRAVERLELLDQLKSDFISNVSHELRTPLTVVEGLGITLATRRDEIGPELRDQMMERLVANAKALDSILSRLLDFTRLDNDRVRANITTVDLGDLVSGLVERLDHAEPDHGLAQVGTMGLAVEADGLLLDRIIENLVVNALKHTPTGTQVQIRAFVDAGDAVIEVHDDGPGIPAHEQEFILERFYRGGDPTMRPTRGLGLGLALVTDLLTLHGAELAFESGPEDGTTFRFRLPCAAG